MFYKKDFYVHYSDVDSNNHLKLSSLFNILQEIGCLHSDSAGYGLNQIPTTHLAWIVMAWRASIDRLPSWNEKLHVITWSRGSNSLYAYRDYEIYDENENLIVKGSSKWVLFNVLTNHIEKIPVSIIDCFCTEKKCSFNTPFSKLKEPSNSAFTFSYSVLRRDIDTNGHVNNNNYLQIALEALPEEFINRHFSSVEIMYKHGAMLGDTINCFYAENENGEQIITMKSKDLSQLHAIVKLA